MSRSVDLEPHDDSTARVALARYVPQVIPLRVEAQGNRGGFSGAAIWRVETAAGDFALRRWPQPGLPRERIAGLHRLLEHLWNAGLRCVAVPVRATDGATLTAVAGQLWQLESWLPGVADFHARPSNKRLSHTLAALAQWHRAAERFVPEATAAPWFFGRPAAPSPAALERLAILTTVDAGRVARVSRSLVGDRSGLSSDTAIRDLARRVLSHFQRTRAAVAAELQLLRETPFRVQPCLRDVWHDHVLFEGDAVTGLIDPSACRIENVATDLARLIGSLVEDDRAAWDFALAEYQRQRPLSANELALVAVLDRSGVLLSGWTWLEWLYIDHRSFPDVASVAGRLTEIARRMERLV